MNCIKHLAEYSKHLYIVPQSYPWYKNYNINITLIICSLMLGF
jgi:hypothetical protein